MAFFFTDTLMLPLLTSSVLMEMSPALLPSMVTLGRALVLAVVSRVPTSMSPTLL